MNRSLQAGLVAALISLAVPAGMITSAAASTDPARPATGSVDQPLRYGPAGTVPIGRTDEAPSEAAQQEMRSRPLRPVNGQPRLIAATRPYGGDFLRGPGGATCTNGFNVTSAASIQYMMTAGHCASLVGDWYWPATGSASLAARGTAQWTLGANGDHGTLKSTGDRPNQVRIASGTVIRTLTSGGDPRLAETVCASLGATNLDNCGTVVALNQTITAVRPDGSTVSIAGLARMENPQGPSCPKPGDSGSPVLKGSQGVGIVSAVGETPDHVYCLTWIQPLGRALTLERVFLG